MAKINGTVCLIQNGADTLLWTKSCTLNVEQNLPDATTKDSSGWAEHINGLRSWTIDFDGAYDISGSGATPNEIVGYIMNRTADATVKFGTAAAFTAGWTGSATFKNISIVAGMEDVTTFSGQLVGNGALAAIV